MENDFLKNFGMVIPHKASDLGFIEEDPNGVPIYAKCPSTGLCACTGACRKILGYDTDPEKIKAYREDIERRNKLLEARFASFSGSLKSVSDNGKTKVWSWEIPRTDK